MALTVNTNITSVNARNNLSRTTDKLQKTYAKISSGLRINSAADDAAGLGVAENLDADRRSMDVARRNTMDGISTIQVAEGATSETGNIIKRMRELAVQSASETLANPERQYIQDEFTELSGEVERIAQVTNFNGVALNDGSATQIGVQVGIDNVAAQDRIQIQLGDLRATTLGVSTGDIDLSTATGAQAALAGLDTALSTVSSYRSSYGAVQNRLESAERNLSTSVETITASRSRVMDADFAHETAEMSKLNIMQQAGVAVLGQANQITQGALRLIG